MYFTSEDNRKQGNRLISQYFSGRQCQTKVLYKIKAIYPRMEIVKIHADTNTPLNKNHPDWHIQEKLDSLQRNLC